MTTEKISYQRHRFPAAIISHAVWLYHQFFISFREVEEFLAEHDIIVTYESVRFWCLKFTPANARELKKQQGCLGDTIDVLVQRRRSFFRRLSKGQGNEPRWLVTDKLRSYDVKHRTVMPAVAHIKAAYAYNRAEISH